MTHPPEPWKVVPLDNGRFEIDHDADGSVSGEFFEEEARRIVACVNFLRYVDAKVLEKINTFDAKQLEHNTISARVGQHIQAWHDLNPHLFEQRP